MSRGAAGGAGIGKDASLERLLPAVRRYLHNRSVREVRRGARAPGFPLQEAETQQCLSYLDSLIQIRSGGAKTACAS